MRSIEKQRKNFNGKINLIIPELGYSGQTMTLQLVRVKRSMEYGLYTQNAHATNKHYATYHKVEKAQVSSHFKKITFSRFCEKRTP
jgi:hypothetical protein